VVGLPRSPSRNPLSAFDNSQSSSPEVCNRPRLGPSSGPEFANLQMAQGNSVEYEAYFG
jgi:hypothetical protein